MEDFPIAAIPAGIPAWTENYALAVYDTAREVSLFLHLGRWRKDPTLWRELIAIALADGSVVAHRGIGRTRASANGPGGGMMAMEIVADGARQRWSAIGGARRVAAASLRDAILADGPHERLQFALDFTSGLPVWDASHASASSAMAGHGHIEQIGRVTGLIRVDDECFAIDALGNRDHSRGPRVMDRIAGHLWMQGIFPDGSWFQAYEAQESGDGGAAFSAANVFIDGRARPAEFENGFRLPRHGAITMIREPVPFTLRHADGVLSGVVDAFPHVVYAQYTAPWDSYIGARQLDAEPNRRYVEQSIRLTLDDGRVGHGHMERTVPGKIIHDPA